MREQREPWLTLPDKDRGSGSPRLNSRFRTHIVTGRPSAPAPAASLSPSLSSPSVSPPSGGPLRGHKEPELSSPSGGPLREHKEPELQVPTAGIAPTPAAIERAAAAAAISQPALTRLAPEGTRRSVADPSGRALRSVVIRAPAAPDVGLNDLPAVSPADWAAKVGEAAKMVDVV